MSGSAAQAQKTLVQVIKDDRKALEKDDAQARELFFLIRKGRRELSTKVFNDWRFAIGMFGYPIERLKRAKAIYEFALAEMNDEGEL